LVGVSEHAEGQRAESGLMAAEQADEGDVVTAASVKQQAALASRTTHRVRETRPSGGASCRTKRPTAVVVPHRVVLPVPLGPRAG
jgi:hypothetical protein